MSKGKKLVQVRLCGETMRARSAEKCPDIGNHNVVVLRPAPEIRRAQPKSAPSPLALAEALKSVKAAHDKLSEAIENPDGTNDAEHDAAVQLLEELNALYASSKPAPAKRQLTRARIIARYRGLAAEQHVNPLPKNHDDALNALITDPLADAIIAARALGYTWEEIKDAEASGHDGAWGDIEGDFNPREELSILRTRGA